MKKIFVSTGLAAISAAGLQSVQADTSDIISPKAWSVSGTLRGFYDDNYNLANTKRGSWGAELSPSVSYNLPLQQTDMGVRVNYGLYYYDDRRQLLFLRKAFDQELQADIWLNHAFNERWKFNFTDTVAYGFNPLLAQPISAGGATFRVNGNNLSNHANMSLDTQWTKEFGTSLSYGNDFYDYENSGGPLSSITDPGVIVASANPSIYSPILPPGAQNGWRQINNGSGPSLAGLLDRVEQNVGLSMSWTFSPETMILAGYTFSWSQYLGNEPVAVYNYFSRKTLFAPGTPPLYSYTPTSYVFNSNSRDGNSHNVYVGLNKQLTANLILAMTVGVAYSANDNNPFQHNVDISPTANVSLSYNYLPGSYVQLGLTQSQNSTDVVAPANNGSETYYQNTTVIYGDINHKITPKLSGTLIGRYQYSSFQGGSANSGADQEVNVGVNLTYTFSRHFSADLGYNFDDLLSDLTARGFSRNNVYLGVTASY
jgi:hypothetical protein